jgi:hypothetical protein
MLRDGQDPVRKIASSALSVLNGAAGENAADGIARRCRANRPDIGTSRIMICDELIRRRDFGAPRTNTGTMLAPVKFIRPVINWLFNDR